MTTNEPISDCPPIDLTLLPLEQTAATLRLLGLQLVTMLLEGEKQPSLSSLLPPSLVELLLPGGGVAAPPLTYGTSRLQRRWQRWAEWRQLRIIISWLKRLPVLSRLFRPIERLPFVRRFSPTWRPPDIRYNDLVEKAARNQISSPEWRREVNRRLYKALYGRPPKSMPPLFWPLIGEMAWNDLAVLRQVGQQIRDYLRPHYLFHPQFGSAPELSPKTFWALIALARSEPAGSMVTAEQRSRYVGAHHLQQIARDQVLVEDWAGFWDQWLLWQAQRHWPAAFVPKTEMRASLASLPLFEQFSGESPSFASDQSEVKQYKMEAPNWRDLAPEWLLRQYQQWQFD